MPFREESKQRRVWTWRRREEKRKEEMGKERREEREDKEGRGGRGEQPKKMEGDSREVRERLW